MSVTVDPLKTNKPWLGSLSVTVAGGVSRSLADLFSDSVSLKNYDTGTNTTDRMLQDAIDDQYVRNPNGAAIFVPPGVYDDWQLAQGAVVAPSNFTIWAIPGTTKIVPDLTTLALASSFTFPLFNNCMIGAGNPTTRHRSGEPSAGSVDPTTVTQNIHIFGLGLDNSEYFDAGRVQLVAGKFLSGIELYFSHRSAIEHCYVYGMPNSGLNFGAGHRDCRMADNHVSRCGYLCASNGTRNGISSTGWVDATSETQSSKNLHLINNKSNYNWQEGIQHSSTGGAVITGNILIGNHEYGIEGENTNSDGTKTAAGIGYEIPSNVIVENNIIDGRDEVDGTKGIAGISWGSGNEGNISICNNKIRHTDNSAGISPQGSGSGPYVAFTSGSGILASQTNTGVIRVCGNTFEDVTPGTTGQIMALIGNNIVARDNTAYNCATTAVLCGVFTQKGSKYLDLGGNRNYGPVKRYADVTLDAGAGNTDAIDFLSFSDARLDGCTDSAIVIRSPHDLTIATMDLTGARLQGVNSAASSSNGAIRFTGSGSGGVAGAYTTTITDVLMDNFYCTFAGATSFPIIFDASTVINDGCITNFRCNNVIFGTTGAGSITNKQLFSNNAKVTNLFANRVGFPDLPNVVIKTTSGTVVMVDSNEAVIIKKDTPQATVVRLPSFCTVGKPHLIADGAGVAGANNITIQLADAVTTYDTIDQDFGARTIIPLNSAGTSWITVG